MIPDMQTNPDLENTGIITIVPMKPLSESKSRLAKSFSQEDREELSLGLLRRVTEAVKASSIGDLWVVGGDARVRDAARNVGGQWIEEMGQDLNDTLGKAFERAFELASAEVPIVDPIKIDNKIISALPQPGETVAPMPYWFPKVNCSGRNLAARALSSTFLRLRDSGSPWQSATAQA